MRSLVIESPAKINLALHVLDRREDGYHELLTLFHRISLRDSLKLEKKNSEGIKLFCSHPQVPKQDNLIVRAYQLLKEKHRFRGGVNVHLNKRIPVGGGLGGGSSNAASFLIAMNQLFGLGLSLKELDKLGRRLGADVPFFIHQVTHALGRERGDRIYPLPFRRRLWFVLVSNRKGIPTREVYEGLELSDRLLRSSLTGITHGVKMLSALLERGKVDEAEKFLVNDLTASAERISLSLRKTREKLRELQLGSFHMSGSGPALFSIFSSQAQALRAFRKLRRSERTKNVFVCHSF